MPPPAATGDSFCRSNYHQNIVVSSHHSHHAHRASFLYVSDHDHTITYDLNVKQILVIKTVTLRGLTNFSPNSNLSNTDVKS